MVLEDISSHLDDIEEILKKAVENLKNRPELKNKKEQFRAIDRSIRQLRKKEIPVPAEMNDIRNSLIAEIEKHSMPVENLQKIYNKALDIVVELGRICRRSPRKDLYLKKMGSSLLLTLANRYKDFGMKGRAM